MPARRVGMDEPRSLQMGELRWGDQSWPLVSRAEIAVCEIESPENKYAPLVRIYVGLGSRHIGSRARTARGNIYLREKDNSDLFQ